MLLVLTIVGQMNQNFDFSHYSPILMKCTRNDTNKLNMKFGSIEASISEIFAIKNCYFSDQAITLKLETWSTLRVLNMLPLLFAPSVKCFKAALSV